MCGSKSGSMSLSMLMSCIAASSSVSSKLHFSGGSGTRRLSSCSTGLMADGKIGYSIDFLFLAEKPETSVRQK